MRMTRPAWWGQEAVRHTALDATSAVRQKCRERRHRKSQSLLPRKAAFLPTRLTLRLLHLPGD